jgi:curved DNA-binding protein CbpA
LLRRKPDVPSCLKILGFTQMPKNKNQIKALYRQLVKEAHPDSGGSFAKFVQLRMAFEDSIKILEQKGGQQ